MPEVQSNPQLIQYVVISVITLSIVFSFLNRQSPSLQISVLNRWMRWLSISLGLAYFVDEAGWLSRPFWVLSIVFFIGWLMLETLYTWFAINALSRSELSLFPRFKENQTGEEWPAQKKLIELKDWLKSKGFKKTQALFADLGGGMTVRSSIFENEDRTVRFQILFVPQSNGDIGFNFSFTSENEEGRRYVTDNFAMPFGGFYPDNWTVTRKPWKRKIQSLHKLHLRRLASETLKQFSNEPISDLNQQQRLLEQVNTEEGFLVPQHLQDEYGRLTWEGRYRVWKEVWLLNYFGISMA